MISWLCGHLAQLINSLGLVFDILGAWFVAVEVVRQFQGRRYGNGEGWSSGNYVEVQSPQETSEYASYEIWKYSKMKWGLFFLTVGFLLQLASNWVR